MTRYGAGRKTLRTQAAERLEAAGLSWAQSRSEDAGGSGQKVLARKGSNQSGA